MIFQSFTASNMPKILWSNNSEDTALLFNLIALKPETQVIISDQSLILRTTLLNFMPLSAFFLSSEKPFTDESFRYFRVLCVLYFFRLFPKFCSCSEGKKNAMM